MTAFSFYSAKTQSEQLAVSMKRQAMVLAENLAATSGDYLLNRDYSAIELSLIRSARFPGVLFIQMCDIQGKVISDVVSNNEQMPPQPRFGQQRLKPPSTKTSKIDIKNQQMLIWQPILLGEHLGWIRVGYNLDDINKAKVRNWRENLLAGLIAVSCAILLLTLALKRPMASIARYTRFAATLNENHGKQIPICKNAIELEKLGTALNWASSKLNEQSKEINSAMKYLERLAAFPEMNPNIVLSIDRDGEISYLNPHAQQVLSELSITPKEIKNLLPANIDTLIQQDSNVPVNACELETTFADRTFLWTFSPVKGQQILHGYALEITERVAAEQQAQAALMDKLSANAANKEKSQFLANMSHELRTPLNAIIGYSEILEEDLAHNLSEQGSDIRKIQQAAKHLLALISDILDLSKIEAGKMELFIEEVDIKNLIDNVIATITPLTQKKYNKLSVKYHGKMGNIHTDVTKLRQVLYNLLSNACKFTENGQITLTVSCQQSSTQIKGIAFEVKDSGIGMDSTQLHRIFKPFSQADNSTTRKYGGTGLGLSISQWFCEMLGGNIKVASETNKGSTFTVWLPSGAVSDQNNDHQTTQS